MSLRKPCHKLTYEEAVAIHLRLMAGEFYSRIARDFDVNQGRIADVKFGRLYPTSLAEALRRKAAQGAHRWRQTLAREAGSVP